MARAGSRDIKGGEQIWVVSASGSDEEWRRRLASEFYSRGALASGLQEAQTLVVIVGLQFISQGGRQQERSELSAVYGVIYQALKADILLIPLLVDGAGPPGANDLPETIRNFQFQNALRLESQAELPGIVAKIIAESRLRHSRAREETAAGTQSARSVFISYRRDDSSLWAQMLARSLALLIGSEGVYLDVGTGRPGGDFRAQINESLQKSSDVAVLIGPGFLAADRLGSRRIDRSDDYVRWEIKQALGQKKQIHVVLISGGQLPDRSQLPQEIGDLAEITAIYELSSIEEADRVARNIVNSSGLSGAIRGLGLSPRLSLPGTKAGQGYETRAKSIVNALADHGWRFVKSSGRKKDSILSHDQYPDYRFRLLADLAEILLEEKSLIGLNRWVQRSSFSISPHETDDLAVFQLSARLLEAAIDPLQYLNRVGRINLKRGAQPPMRSDRLAKTLRDYSERNEQAMEAHLILKRKLAAGGQTARIILEGNLPLPAKAKALAVSFSPQGNLLAVATEKGVYLFQGEDWSYTRLTKGGWFQSITISQAGLTAAASSDRQLSIWDSRGNWIAKKVSPYSFFKRVSSEPRFKVANWSPDGNMVACCDEDKVWLYLLDRKEFIEWKYPIQQPLNWENGLTFTPDGRQLIVYAHQRYLWLVDLETWQVRASLELAFQHDNSALSRANKSKATGIDVAFHAIYQMAVSPQGDFFVCAGSSGQIMLFDPRNLLPGQRLVGHEPLRNGLPTNVEVVSFRQDGRLLASLASDKRLLIWDTSSWLPIAEARVSWSQLSPRRIVLAWIGNSPRLVGISSEGELEVWGFKS